MTDRDAVPTELTTTPNEPTAADDTSDDGHWLRLLGALSGDLTRHVRNLSRELLLLRDEGVHAQVVDDCLEMATRLQRTCRDVDRLTQVAGEPPSASVNDVLARTVSLAQFGGHLRGIEIALTGTNGAGPPNASTAALEELVRLLLDDAVEHAGPGGRVEVSSERAADGGALIHIGGIHAPVPRRPTLRIGLAQTLTALCGGSLAWRADGVDLHLPPAR